MEKWEVEHIQRNLQCLIRNTICNPELTEPLIEKGILTIQEAHRLTNLLQHGETYNAAKEFYKILIENSAMVERLLTLPVKLAGESKPLKKTFPYFDRHDALTVLKSVEMSKQTLSITTTILMDQELPKPHPLYIPRSISNRRKLSEKIFRIDCKDVFVFKGVDLNTLEQLVEPHVVRMSDGQQTLVTCRHIYLEDEEDWDCMTLVCRNPMHLVGKEGDDYVLLRSTKVTNTVLNQLFDHCSNKSAFVSEDEFVLQLMSNKDEKGALLCDVPGIGKTWLMENIARKLRAHANGNSIAVFYLDVTSLSRYLMSQESLDDANKTLSIILNRVSKSKIGASLLHHLSKQGILQLFFLLDGFDEISLNQSKLTTSFLKNLVQQTNVALIMSSRPHMRVELEQKFNLISFDIIPFERSEQVKYITGLWKRKYSSMSDDVLQNLANQCVTSTKYIKRNENRDMFGIPLMCYILADINEKYVKLLSISERQKSIPTISTIKSAFDLYEVYVESRIQKISNEASRKAVMKFHVYEALDLMFPEISRLYFEANQLDLQLIDINEVLQAGILKPSEEVYSFIHRSFADYLTGKFFSDIWMKPGVFDPDLTTQARIHFIQRGLKPICHRFITLFLSSAIPNSIAKSILFSFQFTTMLWFMDNTIYNTGGLYSQLTAVECISTHLQITSENAKYLTSCRNVIANEALYIIFACVEEKFAQICGLVGNIIKGLFAHNEIKQIFTRTMLPTFFGENSELVILLSLVASSGSLETCSQVFSIFGGSEDNHLLKFCSEFPAYLYSPLEIAIDNNDVDMFHFFYGKIKLHSERLLLRCLLSTKMNASAIKSKTKILEKVLGNESLTVHVSEYLNCLSSLERHNLQLLRNFCLKNRLSLYYLPPDCKTVLLEQALLGDNDKWVLNLILHLFCKGNDEGLGSFKAGNKDGILPYEDMNKLIELNANEVLQLIDLKGANECFLGLDFGDFHPLKNIHKLETLKVLIGMCPDFSKCCNSTMNYLHLAVCLGNLEWVKYLVSMNYDVNQRTKTGRTPLHYIGICTRLTMELLQTLVENGADILAVDIEKENVAHKFATFCTIKDAQNSHKLVNFTLQSGFSVLWTMKNKDGTTPLEMLSAKIGLQHPVVMSILAVIPTDNTTVHSRNMFGDLINNGNDEQLVKYILKTFSKQGPWIDQKEEDVYVSSFRTSDMQQLIDMNSAKDVMMQLRLITVHNAFRNIDNLDTLKLLLSICHDISSSNSESWNYLQFAVCQGKVDWVEYLLENGHDIHHKDRIGCTPLLAISWLRPVDVTRVLLRRGAGIYHVNYDGENVAHRILQFSMYNMQQNLFAWIDYTVENGYEKLWNVENTNGITAFEQLHESILAEDSAQPLVMSTETLLFIFSDQYRANLNEYRGSGSLDISNWTKLVFAQKLNLQFINSNVKHRLLRGSLESGTDKQFVQLLLLLFPSRSDLSHDQTIWQTDNHQGSFRCEYLQAETVLSLIDLPEANENFR